MPLWIRKLYFRILLSKPLVQVYDRFSPRLRFGDRGELAAERFLLKQGLIILERGYQDKLGEIDLIAVDNQTVVFVEVKTRTSDSVQASIEAVDAQKQSHITRTAKGYLKRHHLEKCSVRFDVLAVLWKGRDPEVVHYKAAFEATGEFQIF